MKCTMPSFVGTGCCRVGCNFSLHNGLEAFSFTRQRLYVSMALQFCGVSHALYPTNSERTETLVSGSNDNDLSKWNQRTAIWISYGSVERHEVRHSLSEPHVAGYVFGFLTSQQRQAVAYTHRFHPLKAKSVEIFLISNELLALL